MSHNSGTPTLALGDPQSSVLTRVMDSYTITEKFLIQIFFAPFVSVLVNGKKKGGAHDKPWTPIDQV